MLQLSKQHICYFDMYGYIVGCPILLFFIEILDFLGKFWSSLWELMDTKLKKTTTFHPQTDGQIKVVNRTIVHILRGYCSKHPKIWDEHIHYIQHAYNHAKHSSTQTSPFEACFGYLPKYPLYFIFGKDVPIDGHSDIDREKKFIEQIELVHQMVQE